MTRFSPRDGALLDLDSLGALAAIPADLLGVVLELGSSAGGLVLEGLELGADLAPVGPPGTRRPDGGAPGLTLEKGRAIVPGLRGPMIVSLTEDTLVAWPTSAGVAVRAILVLMADVAPASVDGMAVARESVTARLGFVKPGQVDPSRMLPLAAALGNGRDWTTDHARLWAPEHAAIQLLLRRLEGIEQTIWRAEPEGSVWDRQVLGRNWVRYQTVAAAALQATRLLLESRALPTTERVRLLGALQRQLAGSVERAATELLQLFGPADGAGPYRRIVEGDDGR